MNLKNSINAVLYLTYKELKQPYGAFTVAADTVVVPYPIRN